MGSPRRRPAAATALAVLLPLLAAACGDSAATVEPQQVEAAADLLAIFRLTIEDEWRAEAVYTAVMEDYGPVLPFRNIAAAERRHAQNIAALYEARGIAVPANPWTTADVPRFASTQAACQAGVVGERENIVMYDTLLAMDLPADVADAITRNRRASLEAHLPAFQACS